MTYDDLEAQIARWAQTQPDIRAVLVCGSRARGEADRWSDLDVMILTTDRPRYISDSGWLKQFGEVVLNYLDVTDPGDAEWYTLYEDGLKLDATLLQVEDASLPLEELLKGYPYQGVFSRGIHILFDRLGVPRRLDCRPAPPLAPLVSAEFEKTIRGYFLASTTTAKFIARGELWRAQNWFSHNLRRYLLRMIEWHAYGKDNWYSGRFIEQWADPHIVEAIPLMYPTYERESLKTSLLAMLDLFGWVSRETGARFSYPYPLETHDKIVKLITAIFVEDA